MASGMSVESVVGFSLIPITSSSVILLQRTMSTIDMRMTTIIMRVSDSIGDPAAAQGSREEDTKDEWGWVVVSVVLIAVGVGVGAVLIATERHRIQKSEMNLEDEWMEQGDEGA
jgi:hypothetical protein